MHFNLLLLIGSWDIEQLLRDFHLLECRLRLSCRHMALLQKVVKWGYQVLTEIKVVVVHLCGQDETAGARAVVMKVFRMLKWNQLIFHAMDDEGWGCYIFDFVNVVEPILNQIFEVLSSLVLSYSSYGFEGGHKKKTTWLSFARNVRCRS
jgi:hypothetical protein